MIIHPVYEYTGKTQATGQTFTYTGKQIHPMRNWLEFLTAEGATWLDNSLIGFATQPNDADFWLVPMLEHRILTLSGPDATAFLQGQLTCDLDRLQTNELLLGAHCNVKGRMISSFVAAKPNEQCIQLRVHATNAERSLAALKKYIVFSKAELILDSIIPLALLPKSPAPNNSSDHPNAPAPNHFTAIKNGTHLHHQCGLQELWVSANDAQEYWQQLKTFANPTGLDTLKAHWIQQGMAEVMATTTEEFIPQMLNYDILDGISFKKGCYTGQEVIARLHYRGKTKKRTYMLLAHDDTAQTPGLSSVPIGAEVCSSLDQNQTVGTVIASSSTGVLVTTNTDTFTNQTPLQLRDKSHIKLEWAAQPYAIP